MERIEILTSYSSIFLVFFFLFCTPNYGQSYVYECKCMCQVQGNQCQRSQLQDTEVLFTLPGKETDESCLKENKIDYCQRGGTRENCSKFEGCCWRGTSYLDATLRCSVGPQSECDSLDDGGRDCYRTRNCMCAPNYTITTDYATLSNLQTTTTAEGSKEEDDKLTTGIIIGVVAGIGVSLLVVTIVGLLFYCQRQRRMAGRKEGQENLALNNRAKTSEDSDRTFDRDRTNADPARPTHVMRVTKDNDRTSNEYTMLNRPSNSAINSEYQSLKKPNRSRENTDYMDPGKYTEPPKPVKVNSDLKSEDGDAEGYLDPRSDAAKEYFTLEPSVSSLNYGNGDVPNLDKDSVERQDSSHDYVEVENLNV